MADEKDSATPSEPGTPPTPGAASPPPPPSAAKPNAGGPPPPPPPPSGGPPPIQPSGSSQNNTLMLVLAYLWLLALIPLLVEKEDAEVQWHAKNGLILTIAEFILYVVLFIISLIPVLGSILGCLLFAVLWIGVMVVHIIGIVKALKGERFVIPVLSDYVAKM